VKETRERRSAIMRAVKARDTGPELIVRRLAYSLSPGYRLHRRDIPGSPDLAYVGRKRAIFVHGCFWHGHGCPRGARRPKINASYWAAKIARNRSRDRRVRRQLRRAGWRVLVIWECRLKDERSLIRRLATFLR
jgi:DNA mismatch endonuclease (patch repair protein)